nr:hypothetical protein B0A51_05777 [Rachicladosporium sp. CCFEE 5018]
MFEDRFALIVGITASIGTFLYGFDTGIATTTIAHPSWRAYMGNPSNGITGAVVSTYIAGEAIGAVFQILIADRLGRKRFMQLCCILVTIGCIVQAAAQSIPMFLVGRILAGIAVGAISGTVPVYLSEISSPKTRGFIGGLGGVGLSSGTMTANWVGYACGYAPYGAIQWRLPLAMQLPWGIILFIGLSTYMPDSPRQLVQKGKVDEAKHVFARIRNDLESEEVQREFGIMHAQIEYEMQRKILTFGEMFKLYRRRVAVCIAVQILTCVTGVNVIQYYQTTLYKSLGIEAQTILALAAVWGTCAFVSNVIAINYLPDRWGRRKMLLAGLSCVIVTEIYCAVMQREFQYTNNKVGKAFAVVGIFVFVICYYALINSVTWLYGAEVVPMSIRSRMVGLSAVAHYVVNVGITLAGPTAFANIHENYYYVFVACCACYLVIVYMFFPESDGATANGKTLEEIAASFGDKVIEAGEAIVGGENYSAIEKGHSTHVDVKV